MRAYALRWKIIHRNRGDADRSLANLGEAIRLRKIAREWEGTPV